MKDFAIHMIVGMTWLCVGPFAVAIILVFIYYLFTGVFWEGLGAVLYSIGMLVAMITIVGTGPLEDKIREIWEKDSLE